MISVSFWAPPKTKSNERPFSYQLCQRRRRPLQIISRNAQTTSQKEEEGGGGVRLPTSVARMLKNMMMLRQEEENALSLTPNLRARFRLADHQRRRFNVLLAIE